MDEIDLWRAATAEIKAHDGDFATALFAAGHRAKELRGEGDLAGADVWDRIEAKIQELERVGYRPDATPH